MSRISKKAVIFFVSVLYLSVMTWLGIQLAARYQYQKGVLAYETGQWERAGLHLTRALNTFPETPARILAPRDLFRIRTELGKAQYQIAMDLTRGPEVGKARYQALANAYALLQQAHAHLDKAAGHDPLSYRTSFWLARVSDRLAILTPYIRKYQDYFLTLADFDPDRHYDPLIRYKAAAALRPAGITVRYELAALYHREGMTLELEEQVREIGTIYPSALSFLKKQPYYGPLIRERFRQGCLTALENGVTPRTTLTLLSGMAREDMDLRLAIDFYRRAMQLETHRNTSGTWYHLGGLLLENSQVEKSFDAFEKGLSLSSDLEKALAGIYSRFRRVKAYDTFLAFLDQVNDKHRGRDLGEMVRVRCYMDMGQLVPARARLERMIAVRPTAPAWYQLAQVSAKLKDWDGMELAAQRATVLDPENSRYHYYFSQALKRVHKYERAASAATRAIETAERKTASLLNYRAWIFWSLKDYGRAAEDWLACLELQPEGHGYYFNAARALLNDGRTEAALDHVRRALELAPDNKTYLEWAAAHFPGQSPADDALPVAPPS